LYQVVWGFPGRGPVAKPSLSGTAAPAVGVQTQPSFDMRSSSIPLPTGIGFGATWPAATAGRNDFYWAIVLHPGIQMDAPGYNVYNTSGAELVTPRVDRLIIPSSNPNTPGGLTAVTPGWVPNSLPDVVGLGPPANRNPFTGNNPTGFVTIVNYSVWATGVTQFSDPGPQNFDRYPMVGSYATRGTPVAQANGAPFSIWTPTITPTAGAGGFPAGNTSTNPPSIGTGHSHIYGTGTNTVRYDIASWSTTDWVNNASRSRAVTEREHRIIEWNFSSWNMSFPWGMQREFASTGPMNVAGVGSYYNRSHTDSGTMVGHVTQGGRDLVHIYVAGHQYYTGIVAAGNFTNSGPTAGSIIGPIPTLPPDVAIGRHGASWSTTHHQGVPAGPTNFAIRTRSFAPVSVTGRPRITTADPGTPFANPARTAITFPSTTTIAQSIQVARWYVDEPNRRIPDWMAWGRAPVAQPLLVPPPWTTWPTTSWTGAPAIPAPSRNDSVHQGTPGASWTNPGPWWYPPTGANAPPAPGLNAWVIASPPIPENRFLIGEQFTWYIVPSTNQVTRNNQWVSRQRRTRSWTQTNTRFVTSWSGGIPNIPTGGGWNTYSAPSWPGPGNGWDAWTDPTDRTRGWADPSGNTDWATPDLPTWP